MPNPCVDSLLRTFKISMSKVPCSKSGFSIHKSFQSMFDGSVPFLLSSVKGNFETGSLKIAGVNCGALLNQFTRGANTQIPLITLLSPQNLRRSVHSAPSTPPPKTSHPRQIQSEIDKR